MCACTSVCRLYIVFVFGVPFVSLVVLNAFLVNAVRLSRKRSRDLQPPNLHRSSAPPDLVANAPSYQLERDSTTASSATRMVPNSSSNCQREENASTRSSTAKMIPNSSSAYQLERDSTTTSYAARMIPNSSSNYQLEEDASTRSSTAKMIPNSSSAYQLGRDSSTTSSTARIIPNSSSAYQLERDVSSSSSAARMIPNSSAVYQLEEDSSTRSSTSKLIRRSFAYQLERLRRRFTTRIPPHSQHSSSADYQLEGLGGTTPLPRSPSPVSRRIDTTVMLIGVVIIFIVCQFPALVSRTIWAFADDPSRAFTDLPLYTLNETANFLVLLNSSVNIIPYYFFGRRFRRQFLALFCPYCEMGRRAERRRARCDSAADSALFSYSASHHRDSGGNQHITQDSHSAGNQHVMDTQHIITQDSQSALPVTAPATNTSTMSAVV